MGLRPNVNIISQHLSDGKMHMHMMVSVNEGIIKQHRKNQKAGNTNEKEFQLVGLVVDIRCLDSNSAD